VERERGRGTSGLPLYAELTVRLHAQGPPAKVRGETPFPVLVLLAPSSSPPSASGWGSGRSPAAREAGAQPRAPRGPPPPHRSTSGRPTRATAMRCAEAAWRRAGDFDETTQFLLMGRAHDGEPGVAVVTPLCRTTAGPRCWSTAAGSLDRRRERTARALPRPRRAHDGRPREPLARGVARARDRRPYFRVEMDSLEVWSTPRLDADSIERGSPTPCARTCSRRCPTARTRSKSPRRRRPACSPAPCAGRSAPTMRACTAAMPDSGSRLR
jgi:hypothetical protein